MAAPTLTARVTPTGTKMKDGYKSTIAFAANAAANIFEKAIKPPGMDGGPKIPQTTMHNTTYRTFAAQALIESTDGSFMAAYDPAVLADILALINVEGSITIHYRNHGAVSFYGYLQKFEPGEIKIGEQPEATCAIVCTNWDPVNSLEVGPVYTASGGTP